MTWGIGLCPSCRCWGMGPFCQMLLGYFSFEFLIFNPFPQLIALYFGLKRSLFCRIKGKELSCSSVSLFTALNMCAFCYAKWSYHHEVQVKCQTEGDQGCTVPRSAFSIACLCLSGKREISVIKFESSWFSFSIFNLVSWQVKSISYLEAFLSSCLELALHRSRKLKPKVTIRAWHLLRRTSSAGDLQQI